MTSSYVSSDRTWLTAANAKHPEIQDSPNDSARRLILCFDGTGNSFSTKNSNVLLFFKCLRKDHPNQLVYYQTGMGTYTNPAYVSPPMVELSMALDAAIAWNLQNHVEDAYRFLMQNYTPGDKICCFGFSRGAYTARVLCGFLQKVGLLPRENHAQIPFAWRLFVDSDKPHGLEQCAEYKRTFSLTVEIDFLGLWDTVAALGISGRELPFMRPGVQRTEGLRIFRHALALDEHRAKFIPNFKMVREPSLSDSWIYTESNMPKNGNKMPTYDKLELCTKTTGRHSREVWFAGCHCDIGGGSVKDSEQHSLALIPLRWMIRECFRTDTMIVFDAAMLADIGFGAPPGGTTFRRRRPERKEPWMTEWIPASLILILKVIAAIILLLYRILAYPFRLIYYVPWARCCSCLRRSTNLNDLLVEDGDAYSGQDGVAEELAVAQLSPTATLDDVLNGRDNEDVADARCKVMDELSRWPFWWALEVWPWIIRLQDSAGGVRNQFETRINLGRGRKIYGDAWNYAGQWKDTKKRYIEVHKSVLWRMERGPSGYRPRAWFTNPKGSQNDAEFRWQETSEGWRSIQWVG